MKWFKSLSEPMKIAVITGVFGIIAAVIGSLIAGVFALTSTLANRTPAQIATVLPVTTQVPPLLTTTPHQTVFPSLTLSPTLIPDLYPPRSG